MENKGLLFIRVNSNQWLNSAYNEVTLEPNNLDIYFSLNWQCWLRGEMHQHIQLAPKEIIHHKRRAKDGSLRSLQINKHKWEAHSKKMKARAHTKGVNLYHINSAQK
jgi:hypothetical protein